MLAELSSPELSCKNIEVNEEIQSVRTLAQSCGHHRTGVILTPPIMGQLHLSTHINLLVTSVYL